MRRAPSELNRDQFGMGQTNAISSVEKKRHRSLGERERQCPVEEGLGSTHRAPASCHGVAAVSAPDGHSQISPELPQQLAPRAIHSSTSPAAAVNRLELVDRRTALGGEASQGRTPRAIDEPALVAEQTLVVAARIDELPKRVRLSHVFFLRPAGLVNTPHPSRTVRPQGRRSSASAIGASSTAIRPPPDAKLRWTRSSKPSRLRSPKARFARRSF
jgi:hypothetical protein